MNTLLTVTDITRKALMVLHQKLTFIGNINRQYDASYAKDGAKIGDTLRIRLPNEYVVRTGKTLNVQATTEKKVDLTVATQKGVDMDFSSAEMTMDMDDFSDRVIEPAMAVLAADIEADALTMYKQVYQEVNDVGAAITFLDLLNGRKKLADSLTPTSNRCLLLNTQDTNDIINGLTSLQNPSQEISKQYREGMVAERIAGFGKVYESTLLPIHTTGTEAGVDTGYNVTAVSSDGLTLTVDTGTGTFAVGDIIQIADVNRVHPETKADTGIPQQFVVTTAVAATGTSIAISPALITSGARQTVSAAPAANAAVEKVESDDSTAVAGSADYGISLGFHRDAFAFASADLEMPDGVDFARREVYDGLSMRIIRAYDINNDQFPCRLDVLYGYKAIRPQLATRFGFN